MNQNYFIVVVAHSLHGRLRRLHIPHQVIYAVIALAVPMGWLGLIGPVTITVLLVFVSGIPLVEQRHAGEPDWEAYKQRTSSFLPMPPHRD